MQVTYIGLSEYFQRCIATVYKGNIIKNLIMDCQSYTKYRPNAVSYTHLGKKVEIICLNII